MKFPRYISFGFAFGLLLPMTVLAQLRFAKNTDPIDYATPDYRDMNNTMPQKWSLPGLSGDKQSNYKPARPYMSLPVNTNALLGDSYWVGSITTQSYNQGKIGRFYYWDTQGNLRGSLLFLDIAGKNKRGLKLVFPRQRAIF
jgi:hypothetical protein